jgi:glycosyltransferase involved in cell wall biosynthesis
VTYTSWRVPSPLWNLGIPFIWGPISGTEVFPLACMSSLSLSAGVFELLRLLQTSLAKGDKSILACARQAVAIPVPHQQAVEFLSRIRDSRSGVGICHNFFFPDQRMKELEPKREPRDARVPLRAFAAGNLEGRKGVAIALHAIAKAKERGVRVEYHVTSRGPELSHLQNLSRKLGL